MNNALKYSLLIIGVLCALAGAGLIAASLPHRAAGQDALPTRMNTASEAGSDPAATEPLPTVPSATEPEPDPEPDEATLQAQAILEGMTLHEKVCQVLFVNPDAITGVSPTTVAGEITAYALEDYPVGGLIFFNEHLQTRDQTVKMLSGMRSLSAIAPFLGVDEEGGRVCRVMSNPRMGTTKLDSMFSYHTEGADTARANGQTMGADLAALGFNLDFAPVADVWSNDKNTVIGNRAYSDDYAQAAQLVASAVEGFHQGGVACVLKHFPGHGDSEEDSHKTLPTVNRSLEQLRSGELLPFASGIQAGADMVMVGHLLVPEVDEKYPASLSYEVVTGLLRRELGFDGVVITDGINMKALNGYSESERCLLALNAGCDMVLGVEDVFTVTRTLEAAVETGELPADRLDESVLRILRLKIRLGILEPEKAE